MNTLEFLLRMNEIINTKTTSTIQESIKQAMVTRTFIEVSRDFLFWASEKHRDILDEFLKEKFSNASVH